MQRELTQDESDRQDWVDNAINGLLMELSGKDVDWDIAHISEVREVCQTIICDKLKLMTEMEFYPYFEA